MLTLPIALLLSSGVHAAVEPVTLCFEIQTAFTDPAGDFWVTNIPRLARGVFFTTAVATSPPGRAFPHRADDDGCTTIDLDTSVDHIVRVRSQAEIGGITISSYRETAEETFYLQFRVFTLTAGDTEQTFPIPWSQDWGNLAVGMWAIWRSDMHLGTFSSRRCCHSTGHTCYSDDEDGTCDTGTDCDDVQLYGDEIEWEPTEVKFINRTYEGAPSCCSSWWPSSATGEFPAVVVNQPLKFSIAHELGHDMVEMRMGVRTSTDANAALDDCMGCYNSDLTDCDEDDGGKGLNTREFHSVGAREGWAHFYSAYLWNVREADCSFNSRAVHDLDLDSDIDNNWNAGDTGDYDEDGSYDGSFDCEGFGVPDEPGLQREDPLNENIDARDWLEDVYGEELCGASSSLDHVGTQYDWMRYFWDMYTDSSVDVADLGDLYVDACPTNWASGGTASSSSEWPTQRFASSADHHDLTDEHEAEDNNGQDH